MGQSPSSPRAEGFPINTTAKKPQFYSLIIILPSWPSDSPLRPYPPPPHPPKGFSTFVLRKSNKGSEGL